MSDYDEAKAQATQGCGFLGLGCLVVLLSPVIIVGVGLVGWLFGIGR